MQARDWLACKWRLPPRAVLDRRGTRKIRLGGFQRDLCRGVQVLERNLKRRERFELPCLAAVPPNRPAQAKTAWSALQPMQQQPGMSARRLREECASLDERRHWPRVAHNPVGMTVPYDQQDDDAGGDDDTTGRAATRGRRAASKGKRYVLDSSSDGEGEGEGNDAAEDSSRPSAAAGGSTRKSVSGKAGGQQRKRVRADSSDESEFDATGHVSASEEDDEDLGASHEEGARDKADIPKPKAPACARCVRVRVWQRESVCVCVASECVRERGDLWFLWECV